MNAKQEEPVIKLLFLVACNKLLLLKETENFCQGKNTGSQNNLGCKGPLEVMQPNLLLKAGLTSKLVKSDLNVMMIMFIYIVTITLKCLSLFSVCLFGVKG